MRTKKEIRRMILAKRDGLSTEERKIKSEAICDTLIALDEFRDAKAVLCFIPYLSEVDIRKAIDKCIEAGKMVFAPTVCGEDIHFYLIHSFEELIKGYKGILEPEVNPENEYSQFEDDDICIMPGVAFDTQKNRVGYGKGFYDRFLSNGFKGKRIAVAFEEQIVEEGSFEADSLDIKPNLVITDARII